MLNFNPIIYSGKFSHWIVFSILLIYLLFILSNSSFSISSDNGFDLSDSLVPREEIFHGGPPRDGIAAIDNPVFIKVKNANYLKNDDRILGLLFDGIKRAYPVKILNYHEIVNDKFHGQSVVVSYCPLCGSGMAFKSLQQNGDSRFGVSGLLYNSDMLLYDRKTESLWSQISGIAISGKLKGNKLIKITLTDTTWANWLQLYPNSQVLSIQTGYFRNYNIHPYGDYDANRTIYFPVKNSNARFHPKQRVVGLTIGKKAKAWSLSDLDKHAKSNFTDQFAGETLTIKFDSKNQSVEIYNANGQKLTATNLFWFAWYAFHPDTEVYKAK